MIAGILMVLWHSGDGGVGVVEHVHSGVSGILWRGRVGIDDRDGEHFVDAGCRPSDIGPVKVGVGDGAPGPVLRPPVARIVREAGIGVMRAT